MLDFERACLLSATNANEIAKAQATFLATVVSKFTTEAFHTLRRYLQSTSDTKSLLSLLLKAQRFTDAGIAMGTKALETDDFREKQGMLSVSLHDYMMKMRVSKQNLTPVFLQIGIVSHVWPRKRNSIFKNHNRRLHRTIERS